jgi:hypothetical protein
LDPSAKNTLDYSIVSLPQGKSSLEVKGAAAQSSGSLVFNIDGHNYTINLIDIISSISNFYLNYDSSTITFSNRSGSNITSTSQLEKYLNSMYPVKSKISTVANDMIDSLHIMVNGAPAASLRAKIAAINGVILNQPTGVLNLDLGTLRNLLTDIPGATLQDDIGTPQFNNDNVSLSQIIGGIESNIASLLGDPVSGSKGIAGLINAQAITKEDAVNVQYATTLTEQLSEIIAYLNGKTITFPATAGTFADLINGNSGTAKEASNISATAANTPTFEQTDTGTIYQKLDNSLKSLPENSTDATITSPATVSGNSISITFGSMGTYTCTDTSADKDAPDNLITFTNSSNNIVLKNVSGIDLMDRDEICSYLKCMYPSGSIISFNNSDVITSIMNMVGGSSPSMKARIAAFDRQILLSPTGIVYNDLFTARKLLFATPGITLEHDIGVPLVNGSASNIASILGGSGTIADLIGNPGNGTGGLAALIGAASLNSNMSLGSSNYLLSSIKGATNIYDQLNNMIALFAGKSIQFPSVASSFAALINGASEPN